MYTAFCLGILRERNHLEEPCIDGGNTKMDLQEMEYEGMDWINVA
jgi:hypothetical protein